MLRCPHTQTDACKDRWKNEDSVTVPMSLQCNGQTCKIYIDITERSLQFCRHEKISV